MNVVALWAGAFWFLNTSGVYRNPLLQEYLDRGYEYKKIIPFVLEDYKVMFLIHNYYLRDINERYNAMFSTDMYDDFSRQIDILEKKGFVKNFGQSNLQFCFWTSSIAYFEFINFYSFNILWYYNIYE